MIAKAEDKTDGKETKPKPGLSFPRKEIELCIRDFLREEAEVQAAVHSETKQPKNIQNSSFGPQPTIDSLVCVEVLVELESKVIPFPLPESLIRAGGYDSVDEVVMDLLPRIKARWDKHYGVNK